MARAFLKIVRFFGRPRVFDTTLVIVLSLPGVIALLVMLSRGEGTTALGPAHYVAGLVFLLMRRRRPILVAVLAAALDTAAIMGQALVFPSLASAIALYSLGRYTAGRATVITSAAIFAVAATTMELGRASPGGWVPALFGVAVPVGIGQIVRLRNELGERSRRDATDVAVRAERRRIARELHDVVAHHITVINALVGGARATLPPEQEVTRDALESAEQTARQAMSEMRQLLDVLRADNEGADAATGLGAERLPALIQEANSAGLPASLSVTGAAVPLPAAVDHAVYRIVQEALTNTRKHAVSARASVHVAYEGAAVEVEVVDDGLARQSGALGFGLGVAEQEAGAAGFGLGGMAEREAGAAGFGLGGMAERVALCGGRLSTGPRPEGGFRVHARIPLEQT
ncbi:sensor histidine kinase [Nonomuraea sp. K274]|uniref:histidine kinase n=1 Tax=Nonomuraea cypriaca TaxID=1187855 RepID=A0A931F1Q5_9ACTN|nr:histidine kinase [Nonomuraea cypriaca]MBF8190745.1 sensor histidine kinase [Nonomuraea cypriaca]